MSTAREGLVVLYVKQQTEKAIGCGFLLTSQHVVTCVHVVEQAVRHFPALGEEVFLNFPLRHQTQAVKSTVSYLNPTQDIAILTLARAVDINPVALITHSQNLIGRSISAYGVPHNYPEGVWVDSATLLAQNQENIYQIDSTNAKGVHITNGFSGSPVWDTNDQNVLGMVYTKSKNSTTTAFMVSAREIIKSCTQAGVQLNQTSNRLSESVHDPVPLHSDLYISTPEMLNALNLFISSTRGQNITIHGFYKSGRTSLVERFKNKADQYNKHWVTINLSNFLPESFEDPKNFLEEFSNQIASELMFSGLNVDPEYVTKLWQGKTTHLNIASQCMRYFLRQVSPLVVALEEVDIMLQYSIKKDFFPMLRSWNNLRATDNFFRKLDLVFTTSIQTKHLIETIDKQSPFNVGTVVNLQDFNLNNMLDLNKLYQSPLHNAQVERLYTETGGHPYLVRIFLQHAANNIQNTEHLFDVLDQEHPHNIYYAHLAFLWNKIQASEIAQKQLKHILSTQNLTYTDVHILESLGIVKSHNKGATFKGGVFKRYFTQRLIKEV